MKQEDDRFPVRKNPRIPHYDYSTPGYYFVTICTKEKHCIFGQPGRLSPFGRIAQECFAQIPEHFQDIGVDKYVVMPNHVHGIIVLHGKQHDLSMVLGVYKSAVTKRVREVGSQMDVWQTSFHDHIIRSEQDYQRIWNYIDTNPMRWKDDCFFVENAT